MKGSVLTCQNCSVNIECASLDKDEKLSAVIARSLKRQNELPPHTNNIFLNNTQLSEKCTELRKQRNLLQLSLVTKSKQLHRLNKSLSLYKRFMVLLSQNNAPRERVGYCGSQTSAKYQLHCRQGCSCNQQNLQSKTH